MEFISKNAVSKLIGAAGEHLVRITKLVDDMAAQKEEYNDRTPQVKVTFENEEGKQISAWMNLKGYKSFAKKNDTDIEGEDCLTAAERKSGKFTESSDGYAVEIATAERVQSKRKTESALSIIAKLGNDAGIPENKKFGLADLQGLPVGIYLEHNAQGQLRFRYSMPAAQVGRKKSVPA